MTIVEFLLARITEDEDMAQAALTEAQYAHLGATAAEALLGLAESEGAQIVALEHYQRHGPVRVLAECEAKRRIVELHRGFRPWPSSTKDSCETCADNTEADYDGTPMVEWPCPTLRILALPYADHADYDTAWRP